MKHKNTCKKNKYTVPQLSYDCRRKINRAKQLAKWMRINGLHSSVSTAVGATYALSYIADDIMDIDNELKSLGLFDESMGVAPGNFIKNKNK
ncbi:hypothetical protein DQZ30_15505 [Salmonella enterica subsp. diarizonae]|nr:hypothetical protein [Salmonella enterica]ECI4530315.1 hypothetical protein [Salmonella enterica subsp. diarizonae]EJA5986210.1 hypothetical protein [Salmonella enterica]EJU2682196.1 hypothetical protein [Salmonella enterica]EJX3840186.1 hypothetical protein [Salmonella enterica]